MNEKRLEAIRELAALSHPHLAWTVGLTKPGLELWHEGGDIDAQHG